MAKGMFDDSKINLTCGDCGKKHPKTVAWIKTHREFTCSCGTRTKIEAGQFVAGLKQADKARDEFRRKLRSLSKGRR